MLDMMYDLAKRKKENLKEKIDSLELSIKNYGQIWKEFNFKERPCHIGGIDGSMNYQKFEDIALYAVSSTAVINNGNGLKNYNFGDIGVIYSGPFLRERIRFIMSIFETKAAIKILKDIKPEYILLDGSIIGSIIMPPSFGNYLNYEIRKELTDKYYSHIEEYDFDDVEIYVDKLENYIVENYKEKRTESYSYLIYLEHLYGVKYLLENFGNKIIAISKESTSHRIFEDRLPDIALFNLASKKEGRSDIYKVNIDYDIKKSFPILEEFFRYIDVNLIYARFQDNKPILRIETVNSEIEDIVQRIKNECVDGYPFILKKAHIDVKIENKDISNIYDSLGIFRREGREML